MFFDVQCASIAESNCCRVYSQRIPCLILEDPMSKFIFVTGGVASSVGKGITVASLGRLLKNRGISVSLMKLDPHIKNEIKDRIHSVARGSDADVVIVEVGGTVGDIEGEPFLEAIRQMRKDVGRRDVLYLHVTLLPYLMTTK